MRLGRDNMACLEQGIALLEQLDDELFGASPPGLSAGGIGPQFRHVIDYYQSFLRDLSGGRIDYDQRDRDLGVETDRACALTALQDLVRQLRELPTELPAQIVVKADGDPQASPDELFSPSSPARELMFLASHTVHHYAIIAVTLAGLGHTPPSEFGVAPSTLRFWKSLGGAPTR